MLWGDASTGEALHSDAKRCGPPTGSYSDADDIEATFSADGVTSNADHFWIENAINFNIGADKIQGFKNSFIAYIHTTHIQLHRCDAMSYLDVYTSYNRCNTCQRENENE